MEPILVLAHTEPDGTLARPALEVVSHALSCAPRSLSIGLVGSNVQPAADLLASTGARILGVTGDAYAQARYSTDCQAAEALCRASTAPLVLAPMTSRWARALPGLAYRLKGRVDTHVTAFSEQNSVPAVTRWFYRQRMEAVLTREQRPWLVLLESGSSPAFSGAPGPAQVELIKPAKHVTRTTVERTQAPASGQTTILPDAKLLFVAGAGWTKKQSDGAAHASEAEELILRFLGAANASLGGSKSLVDLG